MKIGWMLVGVLALAGSRLFGSIDVLANLGGLQGETAKGSMILSGSTLYGFTAEGGSGGNGVIFSIGTDGSGFQVLQNFAAGTDPFGHQPHHGFLTLEGSTILRPILRGGADGQGTIFSIQTNGTVPTLHYTFSGSPTPPPGDGAQPHSGLLSAGGGLYYGMTALGGASGNGVIFSYNSTSQSVTTLHSFSMSTGGQPHGQLIWDSTGSYLLGMTRFGGTGVPNANSDHLAPGVVFRFDPVSATHEVLANFSTIGGGPYLSKHGILAPGTGLNTTTVYGLTAFGGIYDEGALFQMDETGGTPTLLHSFGDGADGSEPYGSLVMGLDGLFYGTTRKGGAHDDGTIFRIAQDGSLYEVLASFHSPSTGREPIDNVTFSPDGQWLYGLTQFGGANGGGTIFALAIPEPSTWAFVLVTAAVWGIAMLKKRRVGS